MNKNIIRSSLLALLAIPTLAGCASGGGSDSVTLTVWEDQSNIEVLQDLGNQFIKDYKKTYPSAPSITINWVEQAEASAVEKMVTVNETGNGPDLASVTHDTIITAAEAGVIAPISYEGDVENMMSEDALNAVSTVADNGNKTLYGYPITAESQTLMYNKSKVTADEISTFAKLKTSGKKIAIKESDDGSGYYNFGLLTDSILFGADGTDSKTVNLQTTQSIANILSFYNTYNGCVLDLSPEDAVSSLANGDVVGIVSSPFLLSSVKSAIGEENVGIAKLPSIDGIEQKPFSGYKAYVVNSYSKNPSLANEFAKYLTNQDSQWLRLSELNYYPAIANDEFSEDITSEIADSAVDQVFGESLALSRRMPSIAQMANFWSAAQTTFSSFWKSVNGDSKDLTEAVVREGLAYIEGKI